jgi:ubiquitin C-terminal hydrolase
MTSEKVNMESHRVKGYRNRGNCCFFNAAFQLLLTIPELRAQAAGTSLYRAALLQALQSNDLLAPKTAFWRVIERFLGHSPVTVHQNDAADFITCMLTGLDNELTNTRPTSKAAFTEAIRKLRNEQETSSVEGQSVLYDIIGLTVRHERRLSESSVITLQDELMMVLPLRHNLLTSLEAFLAPVPRDDYLYEDRKVSCTEYKKISRLTPHLILQIQRFTIKDGQIVKLNDAVSFPKTFTIPPSLCSAALQEQVRGRRVSVRYELKCLLMHHGTSASQGHYTAVVRQGGRWLKVDDSVVSVVEDRAVQQLNPYVLLYDQVPM